MRTNGQPSGHLFPKRWPLSNPNQTKGIMKNIRRKIDETDYKTDSIDQIRTTALRQSVTMQTLLSKPKVTLKQSNVVTLVWLVLNQH